MKKLVAIVMSLAMILSCMPMMAFADAKEDQDAKLAEADAEIKTEINDKVLELIKDKELLDLYKEISAEVQKYKDLVDGIVDALYASEEGVNPEALKEYTDELDELIKELNRAVQEYKDRPETQEAIADLLDKAEELKELLEEYGVNFEDGIQEEDFDQIKALVEEELAKFEEDFEAAKAEIEKAIEDLINQIDEEMIKEALEEFAKEAEAWAREKAAEAGVDEETFDEFLKQLEELAAIIDEYKDMEPSEIIDALIEEAKALVEENAEALQELALETLGEMMAKFENGEYDEYIAKTGLDPQVVREVANDLLSYAIGYGLFGESYTSLSEQVEKLQEQVENMAGLQDSIKEKDDAIKKFINGYKVMKAKPTMKKVKALKKKKAKVTFKGLKKLEASKYQINYKTGKKAKNKNLKKKTTSAKKLNVTLKKLKKGKKYTVKVRATYQFKYEGKTYKFTSKWSKAKKVKAKK